jgi:hypothetical protein
MIRIILLFILSSFCQDIFCQDTICLSKDRLARIADTLSHYKSFTRLFYQCDSLLALKSELNTAQGQKLVQKDIQIKVLNNIV